MAKKTITVSVQHVDDSNNLLWVNQDIEIEETEEFLYSKLDTYKKVKKNGNS